MNYKSSIFTSLVALLLIQTAHSQTRSIKAEEISSTLSYTMKNPLHSWTGVCDEFTCVIDYNSTKKQIQTVIAEAVIVSFDSNIGLRNKNAFKAIESKKYPSVKVIASSISTNGNILSVKGNLTFHGVTNPVEFEASQRLINDQLSIKGKFSIKLTDYDLQPPSLLGIKAEDNIDINFSVNFVVE